MGYSASYIIPRFIKHAGKGYGIEPDGKNGRSRERFPDGSGSSLYYRLDTSGRVVEIMSYGSHFPLAHLVLDKAGHRKRWILNGDRWSGSGFGRTNTHNEMAREAAQKSGVPWIIVPFSALREAGIDLESIVPVDMAPERSFYEERTAPTLDQVPVNERKQQVWRDTRGNRLIPPRANDGQQAWPDHTGGWYVSRPSALEGWQRIQILGPEYDELDVGEYQELERQPDGLFHWWEHRHQLGESLFRATYELRGRHGWTKRRALFLSAFDENEPAPLYFLAEMPPGARPHTIAEAREALKPDEVRDAEAAGLNVLRQGDVFAIPATLRTREIPGPSLRNRLVLGTDHRAPVNHRATEVRLAGGRTYARGKLRHVPGWPRRAEHVTITLGDGKTWYYLVLNTVPHSYGIPRAWAISGQVD